MADEMKVIEEVKRRNLPDTELRISRTIPGFLEGELFVVEILRNGENVRENYYYDHKYASSKSRSFTTMDELALWLGQMQSQLSSAKQGLFSRLTGFELVSSLIAIFITLTIIVIVIFRMIGGYSDIQIPDILSNALTVILGFYFGSQVGKARRTEGAEPSKTPVSD